MLAALKSEIRKIYSIRSTYVILLVSLLIMGLFAFWAEGFKAGESSTAITNPHKVMFLLLQALGALGIIGAIVAIMNITHEYRYNTITYTLTTAKSRTHVFLAKLLTISFYSVLFTIFVAFFATLLMYLGLALKGANLSPQDIPLETLARILFVGWGFCMAGFLFGFIIRQQVGAIVGFFAFQAVFEGLISIVLKNNQIYLPFSALRMVANTEQPGPNPAGYLTPGKAAGVFTIYIVIGWVMAWLLFLRRDAN